MGVAAQQFGTEETLVVELVGPAGAGKSTVRSMLLREFAEKRGDRREPARTFIGTAALALRSSGDWLPVATSMMLASPWRSRELIRHLIRVRTMQDELPRLKAEAGGVLLFDEGPVLSLARISRACELSGSDALRRYRDAAIDAWSATLDMVIHLDALDPILTSRINGRRKPHAVKGLNDAEVRSFLAWYRRHYSAILDTLASRGVRVVHFDTSVSDASEVARRAAAILGGKRVR